MRLPNLLETRVGRLLAFFFLYLTEGIPLGFAATAVATQLRRQDVGPAEIGAFVASFYLPWAFKWAFGPFIDVFSSERLGRRRGWILGTQGMLIVTLLACTLLDLPAQLGLLTGVLLIHNSFGAMQDVAIDALAVNTLQPDERGLANGVMFAGAALGAALGGSGVLFLMPLLGLRGGFVFVAACIAAVTVFIVLPMREAPTPAAERRAAGLAAAGREMKHFSVEAFRAFLGTRGAFAGLVFALLPAGAMALGLALQSNLAVELGLDDDSVAWLNLWTQVICAACMVLGGWLSDRYGRRRTLVVYMALMSLPVLYMAWMLQAHHWVMPITAAERGIAHRRAGAGDGTLGGHAVLLGRPGPDVRHPLGDLHGCHQPQGGGHPVHRLHGNDESGDLVLGHLAGHCRRGAGLPGDPAHRRADRSSLPGRAAPDPAGPRDLGRRRRRACTGAGAVLALGCLAWLPYRSGWFDSGAAAPIFETLFTLIFVASAVFLAAGAAALGDSQRRLGRAGLVLAPLLLAMFLRRWWPQPEALTLAVPLAGALVLAAQARLRWQVLAPAAAAAAG